MSAIATEIARRFLRMPVDQTDCADAIRALGIAEEHVYVLREPIDRRYWPCVAPYFAQPESDTPIVKDPPAARRSLTVRPEQVVHALKKQGVW